MPEVDIRPMHRTVRGMADGKIYLDMNLLNNKEMEKEEPEGTIGKFQNI